MLKQGSQRHILGCVVNMDDFLGVHFVVAKQALDVLAVLLFGESTLPAAGGLVLLLLSEVEVLVLAARQFDGVELVS